MNPSSRCRSLPPRSGLIPALPLFVLTGLIQLPGSALAAPEFGEAYELQLVDVSLAGARIEVADVTGDGRPDLVAFAYDEVLILPARRSGGFEPVRSLRLDGPIEAYAVGDVDGDALTDLALLTFSPGRRDLVLFRGRVSGTFDAPVTTTVANEVYTANFGDFDADGRPDVLLTADSEPHHRLMTWEGPEGWVEREGVAPLTAFHLWSAVVDYDGDGRDDVVLQHYARDSLDVLFGDEAQPLVRAERHVGPPAGSRPDLLGGADIDGDGRAELLFTTADDRLLVFGGDPAHRQELWEARDVPSLRDFEVTDVTGDGRPDLALTTDEGKLLVAAGHADSVLLTPLRLPGPYNSVGLAHGPWGSGESEVLLVSAGGGAIALYPVGTVAPRVTYIGVGRDVQITALTTADVNGDGRPDLLLGVDENGDSGSLLVYRTVGARGFLPPVEIPLGLAPADVLARDVTGDGHPDLLVLPRHRSSIWLFPGQAESPGFGPGRVVARLDGAPRFPYLLDDTSRLQLIDFDESGPLDLIVTLPDHGRIDVFPGREGGEFGAPTRVSVEGSLSGYVLVDLDESPGAEILALGWVPGSLSLFGRTSGGALVRRATQTAVSRALGPHLARMDADGLPDLLVLAGGNRMLSMTNLGGGRFADPESELLGEDYSALTLVDVGGDGIPDLLLLRYDLGSVLVRPGRPEGGFDPGELSRIGAFLGLRLLDLDDDGAIDLLFSTPEETPAIGIAWGVPGAMPPEPGPRALQARDPVPNPTRGRTHMVFEGLLPGEAYDVTILDVQGRRVRSWRGIAADSAPLALHWDGDLDDGRRAARGVFFARLATRRGHAEVRLVRVP